MTTSSLALFERAFEFLMRHEGGWVNNSEDKGGETYYGLSRRSYPDLDFKTMSKDEVANTYHNDFWQPGRFFELPAEVAIKVFDMAVNMGSRAAVRRLQRAINYLFPVEEELRLDGIIGRETVHAVHSQWSDDPVSLMQALKGFHWDHYRRLVESDDTSYETWSVGWLRRAFDG